MAKLPSWCVYPYFLPVREATYWVYAFFLVIFLFLLIVNNACFIWVLAPSADSLVSFVNATSFCGEPVETLELSDLTQYLVGSNLAMILAFSNLYHIAFNTRVWNYSVKIRALRMYHAVPGDDSKHNNYFEQWYAWMFNSFDWARCSEESDVFFYLYSLLFQIAIIALYFILGYTEGEVQSLQLGIVLVFPVLAILGNWVCIYLLNKEEKIRDRVKNDPTVHVKAIPELLLYFIIWTRILVSILFILSDILLSVLLLIFEIILQTVLAIIDAFACFLITLVQVSVLNFELPRTRATAGFRERVRKVEGQLRRTAVLSGEEQEALRMEILEERNQRQSARMATPMAQIV